MNKTFLITASAAVLVGAVVLTAAASTMYRGKGDPIIVAGTTETVGEIPTTPTQPTYPTPQPQPTPAPSGSVTVTAGLRQPVSAYGVIITPLEVIDDSRCPRDVTCVWAGTVRIRVTIKTPEGTSERVIALNETVMVNTASITFAGVTPEKTADGGTVKPAPYSFTFLIKK